MYQQCRGLPFYYPAGTWQRYLCWPGRPYPAGSDGYSQSI